MYYNPLEQFTVISLTNSNGFMIHNITNTSIYLLITAIIITFFYWSTTPMIIPTKWSIIIESWLATLLGIVLDQFGPSAAGGNVPSSAIRSQRDPRSGLRDRSSVTSLPKAGHVPSPAGLLYPLIYTIFTVILFSNMLGMIPYSFTTTSHISVTLGFSIAIMIGITLIGFNIHQFRALNIFLPKGTPLILIPLLVFIELISYTARAFSLALRLTANVSAGHCLLGVISMLTLTAATTLKLKYIIIFSSLLILIPLYGLELLVALLQSYVFTLLICSYTADILNMSSDSPHNPS